MLLATVYDVVLGIHLVGVVVAFGAVFAYPLMFAIAAKQDIRSLPVLHRVERMLDRALVNGGLVVVVGAGAYLATEGHHWSQFFVQWGIGAALVIGALVGVVMIPASKRAQETIERDLQATRDGPPCASEEYRRIARRASAASILLSLIVLVTILVMATKP